MGGDELIAKAESVSSLSSFKEFVALFVGSYDECRDEWENSSLPEFLQGLAGFVENIEGYYANAGIDAHFEQPSWRVFADILLAARVYE